MDTRQTVRMNLSNYDMTPSGQARDLMGLDNVNAADSRNPTAKYLLYFYIEVISFLCHTVA